MVNGLSQNYEYTKDLVNSIIYLTTFVTNKYN